MNIQMEHWNRYSLVCNQNPYKYCNECSIDYVPRNHSHCCYCKFNYYKIHNIKHCCIHKQVNLNTCVDYIIHKKLYKIIMVELKY